MVLISFWPNLILSQSNMSGTKAISFPYYGFLNIYEQLRRKTAYVIPSSIWQKPFFFAAIYIYKWIYGNVVLILSLPETFMPYAIYLFIFFAGYNTYPYIFQTSKATIQSAMNHHLNIAVIIQKKIKIYIENVAIMAIHAII